MDPQRFKNFFGAGHSRERVILPETVAMVDRFELFMPKPYPDGFWDAAKTKIKWAIGFGHNEGGDNEPKIIPPDMVITLEQANAIRDADISSKAKWVNAKITAPLTPYMFGAVVSLVYAYGEGRVERESKLIETLNAEEYVKAATVEMFGMNKKKDGTVTDGHIMRRCIEIAFYGTKVEK